VIAPHINGKKIISKEVKWLKNIAIGGSVMKEEPLKVVALIKRGGKVE